MTISRGMPIGLGAVAALSLMAVPVSAQGSLKDAPPPPAPFSWTGPYLGGNAGYSWGRAKTDYDSSVVTTLQDFRGVPPLTLSPVQPPPVPPASSLGSNSASAKGWLGGFQLGHNWQAGKTVYGVETDFQWTGEKGTSSFCATAACANGDVFATADVRLDWFGTLRGRLGYLVDPKWMIYGTGGLAYGHITANYTAGAVGGAATAFGNSATKAGWVVGAGTEGALNKNWLVRLEYLYMDFGGLSGTGVSSTTTTTQSNVPQPGFSRVTTTTATVNERSRFSDSVLRMGLSYKFD